MAYTEFYSTSSGSALNAGSSTADAAPFTYTSAIIAGGWNSGTGVFTVASGTPNSDMASMADGTHFASVYVTAGATVAVFVGRITAVSATTITVSLTIKSGTAPATDALGATTLKVDGAWSHPAAVAFPFNFVQSTMVNSSSHPLRVNFKDSATIQVTAAMTHTNVGPITFQGYTTNAGDGGIAKFSGENFTSDTIFVMLTVSGNGLVWKDLWFYHNYNGTPSAGQDGVADGMIVFNAQAQFCHNVRFSHAYRCGVICEGASNMGGSLFIKCEVDNNQLDDASGWGGARIGEESIWIRCAFHHNGINRLAALDGDDSAGVSVTAGTGEPVALIDCIITDNAGPGVNCNGSATFSNCTIARNGLPAVNDGNGGSGIVLLSLSLTALSIISIRNCIIYNNSRYAVENDGVATFYPIVDNNAFGANTLGVTLNLNASFVTNTITLTGDPFTSGSTGDYTPNNTSGAGADCRGAAGGAFRINTTDYADAANTVSYRNVGAVQHQEAGGSTGSTSIFGG